MTNRIPRPRIRSAPLGALLVILLWGVTQAGSRCGGSPSAVPGDGRPRSETEATLAPTLASPSNPMADEGGAEGAEEGSRRTIEDPPTLGPDRDTCRVRGRVVDSEGAPLPGAVVSLAGLHTWSPNVDPPPLEDERLGWKGWTSEADSEGRFEFEVPPPTAARTLLRVLNGRRWSQVSWEFGAGTREMRPPIQAGDRDLGEIALRPARWIIGRITTPDGELVAGARVRIRHNFTEAPPAAYSQEDGTYEIGRIPLLRPGTDPSTWELEADLRGYRDAVEESVLIDEDSTPARLDLVLAPMFEIRGRVLDADGQPVGRCEVLAFEGSASRRTNAWTETDGGFVMYVEEEGEYVLWASRDGLESPRSAPISTGGKAEDLILEAPSPMRFQVRRADDGTPIEAFTVRIRRDAALHDENAEFWHRWRVEYRGDEHPGGVVDLQAEPAEDLVYVTAPGFLPFFDFIDPQAGDPPTQIIELRTGATIRGQWVQPTGPSGPMRVRIESGRWRPIDPEPGESRWFSADSMAVEHVVTSDAEGQFEATGLRPGLYRVTTLDAHGVRSTSEPVELEASDVHDFGALELARGGVLEGVVLLPPGIRGTPVKLGLGPWIPTRGPYPRTDGEGNFRIESVTPGFYQVWPLAIPDRTAEGPATIVEVLADETTFVTLDLRSHELCRLTLWIDPQGLGKIEAWPRSAFGQILVDSAWTMDPLGRIEGTIEPRPSKIGVAVGFDGGTRLHVFEDVTSLPPGGEVSVQLELPRASLILELSEFGPLEEGSQHVLSLRKQRTDADPNRPSFPSVNLIVPVVDRALVSTTETWSVDPRGPSWTLTRLQPGEYEVHWAIQSRVLEYDGSSPTVGPSQRSVLHQAHGTVRIEESKRALLTLEP